MQKITTFLTFNDQAEEAANFYVSLFADAQVTGITRYLAGAPMPEGSVMTISFQLAGQQYTALNGGPHFTFAQGISLCVNCADQAEVDHLWARLTADGGQEGQCGWLQDRFGVSWQIVPAALMQIFTTADPAKAKRAVAALMQMRKIDIRRLEEA